VTANRNHWLTLLLVGHKSNRDAIGAEVRIQTGAGVQTRTQFETVTTTSSYLSSSDKRVHFGLGASSTVDKIEIRWPSGIRQSLTNIAANQILRIDEPEK
jgi:enediyne biosynthesis protein E4